MIEQIKAEIVRLQQQSLELEVEGKSVVEVIAGTKFLSFDLKQSIESNYANRLKNTEHQIRLLKQNLTRLEEKQ